MNRFDASLNTYPRSGADAPKPPVRLSTVNVPPSDAVKVPSSKANVLFVRVPATVMPPPPLFARFGFTFGDVVVSLQAASRNAARDRVMKFFIRSLRDRQGCRLRAGDAPSSAARLSRSRSFGFADRSHGRGAFIGGGYALNVAKRLFANAGPSVFGA